MAVLCYWDHGLLTFLFSQPHIETAAGSPWLAGLFVDMASGNIALLLHDWDLFVCAELLFLSDD